MEYIIIENGVIINHCCGSEKPENAVEVPSGFSGFIGAKFAALKDDLSGLKPISQQVDEGILTVPDGYKINKDDTDLIRMGQEEIDAVFPPEIWAIPGEFYGIPVYKTFDRYGKFGYFPPEGAVKMQKPQPTAYHKAQKDGTWLADEERAKTAELARARTLKTAEFDRAMADIDAELIRSTTDLVAAMLTPATLAADDDGTISLSDDELERSKDVFAKLRGIQMHNRALREQIQAAENVEQVQAIEPVKVDRAGLGREPA